jgi:hypothetical protein
LNSGDNKVSDDFVSKNIRSNAGVILGSADQLRQFAELNRLSADAAKALLERLLKEPEIAEHAKEYISSPERSDDFKGYNAGEERGYTFGHEAGFAKGTAVGALATLSLLTLAGLTFLARR